MRSSSESRLGERFHLIERQRHGKWSALSSLEIRHERAKTVGATGHQKAVLLLDIVRLKNRFE